MKKQLMLQIFTALFVFLFTYSAAAQWQVDNNSIPIGKGPGKVGFGKVGGSAGTGANCLLDTAPPAFGRCPPDFYPASFSVVCNNSTDTTTQLRNAVAAAAAVNGTLRLVACAGYKITGTIHITKGIRITGDTAGGYGTGANGSYVNVAADVPAFSIETAEQVIFENLKVEYTVSSTSEAFAVGTNAIMARFPTFNNVNIINPKYCWNFISAASFFIGNNSFCFGPGDTGVLIQNQISGDTGDNTITGGTTISCAHTSVAGVQILSSNVRISNIKINGDGTGCTYGVVVSWNSNENSGIFFLNNSSIEGIGGDAVAIARQAGNTKTFHMVDISNNELIGPRCINITDDATGGWVSRGAITANKCFGASINGFYIGTGAGTNGGNASNWTIANNVINTSGGIVPITTVDTVLATVGPNEFNANTANSYGAGTFHIGRMLRGSINCTSNVASAGLFACPLQTVTFSRAFIAAPQPWFSSACLAVRYNGAATGSQIQFTPICDANQAQNVYWFAEGD